MNKQKLESILKIGETIAVEFKRCGNGIENDTYTSVCSFLNRFGGDIFGTVVPLSEEYSGDSQKEQNKKPMIKVSGKKSAIKISDKKSAITEERLQRILESMQKDVAYSTEEIAEKVELKNARTRELLKVLVENNKVEFVGANKNRKYIKK